MQQGKQKMKLSRAQLMRKASLNALGLSILYATMGVIAFQSNLFAGFVGAFISVICFREYQQMSEVAKEMKLEEQQNGTEAQ